MEPFARRLLSLPGGIHFRKLALTWLQEGDLLTMTALVEACVGALESLDITWDLLSPCILHLRPHRDSLLPFPGNPGSAPVDLSKAMKLKDVVFRPGIWRVGWVTEAL
jgi:hypothetical protein